MAATDGTVVGTTRIVDNGSPQCRFNLVLIAEGYRQAELGQFATDAQQFVNTLFATPPFDQLQSAFNVYRVDVSSTDSGADDPAACGGTGATPATYFDASFCNAGIRRLLLADTTTVLAVAGAQVPQWHQILVIVNSPIWGGAGGTIGTSSTAAGWENVAIHELGHSAFGLADEYEYWAGCGVDTTQDTYTGGEPGEPNVTIDANRSTNKWRDLILPATPLPSSSNADCTQCDPQPNPLPAGTVGAFEGGRYFHCGIYRPEFNCMMRNLSGFCAVCRRRIRETLEPFLPPACPAPVFPARPWWACLLLAVVYVIVLIALGIAAAILGALCAIGRLFGAGEGPCRRLAVVQCQIRQVEFALRNCGTGNSDPCRGL
jgi:IgA Peptidase M64